MTERKSEGLPSDKQGDAIERAIKVPVRLFRGDDQQPFDVLDAEGLCVASCMSRSAALRIIAALNGVARSAELRICPRCGDMAKCRTPGCPLSAHSSVAPSFPPDRWIGCQECDEQFICHNGEHPCIRLYRGREDRANGTPSATERCSEEMADSVRGVLQILRNTKGATFKDVRRHCELRGDDIVGWPEWVLNAEGYVTEQGAAMMLYEIMARTKNTAGHGAKNG